MTHEQFAKLPVTQQCLLIKKLSVEVAKRQDKYYRYYLYQMDSFYIEVKVGLYIDNVYNLTSFTDNRKLNQYLEKIDISDAIS